jgi:hypothetical protein
MSRNLTERFLRETELSLASAVSIADVTRMAYRSAHKRPVEYSPDDLAWFRRPLGGK